MQGACMRLMEPLTHYWGEYQRTLSCSCKATQTEHTHTLTCACVHKAPTTCAEGAGVRVPREPYLSAPQQVSSTGCKFALALVITGLHDVDTHWSWRQQRGTRTQGTSEPRAWWHSILLLVFI